MKKQNQNRFILLTYLMLFFVYAGAQQETSERDTTALSGKIEEVTVTAFRTPYNLLNTPAPVNLITPLQLEAGSAFTPVEALNQVPGIIMQHGTFNTNRLTIRGIGSRTPYGTNKIKAYFGEIPLTSGDGETTLEDLENSAITRVEIIKGPSSSLFGAGLGGVILFHPKTVVKDFAQNRTTAGSFATIKNTLSAGVIQKKLNIFALGSLLKSNGFRENNHTNRTNALMNAQYSFAENINLQILLKATKMKAYIPSSLDLPTFQNHPEQAASNWSGIRGYENYLNGQAGISLNIFTRKNEKLSVAAFGSFRNADELRPFNLLKESSDYLGWRGYVQKAINGNYFNITFTSGLEFFREKYNWSTISNEATADLLSDNLEKRSYENLFFQMESSFYERLFISAGVNGNLTRFYYTDNFLDNGDQSGNHGYQPVISPRVGLNFLFTPQFSIFGNVSHGFSTPTFEETLLPAGNINPDIKPETGWNAEMGLRAIFSDQLQANVSYYRIYIRNLLVARRTGEDAYIGVNAGKSLHPGLEAEIRWSVLEPARYPSLVLYGNTTIANYHFQEFVDNEADYSGNNLPGTAKTTWLLGADFGLTKNINLNAWSRFTGKMPVDDSNSAYSDAYTISNLELKYIGKAKHFHFELKGGIQNIFDVKYAAMLAVNAPAFGGNLPRYYYPGNPRNYFISVLIRLE
jgi:iron complex outermembrane recepter protein